MDWLFLPLGALIVIAIIADALWTTMWVDGNSGFLSSRLTTAIWWVWRRVVPQGKHRWLSLNGPITLASTLAMWVVGLWAGWVIIFSAAPDALHNLRTNADSDIAGRIYYVAYTMFTMGNGDLSPDGQPVWQIATALCTATGMVVVTLAVSYIISVISAVVQKRALASEISAYGKSSEDLVSQFWHAEEFLGVEALLGPLGSALSQITEQHMAYPILHYYHAVQAEKASPVTVAILLDALLVLRYGVADEHRPARPTLGAIQRTIGTYLDTLQGAWVGAADEAPPAPDLDKLRSRGIPVVDQATFEREIARYDERRRLALGLVHKAEWHWPPIEQAIGLGGPEPAEQGSERSAPEGAEPAE